MPAEEAQKEIILVVEDEQPLAEVIKKKLELGGYSVVTARDAQQAFAYLEDLERVDAIWLDHYLLGQESGLDFVAKLKDQAGQWRRIPIFVVSNTASGDKVQSYLQLGIDRYYTKSDYRLDNILEDMKRALANGSEMSE